MYSRHCCPGCPGSLANSDSVQKASQIRVLLCLASTRLAGTPYSPLLSLAFPFRPCCLVGRPTFWPLGKSVGKGLSILAQQCCPGYGTSFPAGPRFQGCACNRFESYIRSRCHCLAPLILSPANPSNVAEVAAPVLEEFVSISLGKNLVWAALQYLFQLKKIRQRHSSHTEPKDFLCSDAFGGN